MKKISISLVIIAIIIMTIVVSLTSENKETEYLRLHIRANSNYKEDQDIKYKVRDLTVDYLTPYIAECDTKEKAVKTFSEVKKGLKESIDNFLKQNGFDYESDIEIKQEYFPTRVYEDVTLEEGIYDAVIINLGSGEGNNWWCVVYPPLCFTTTGKVNYRSKIIDVIEKYKRSKKS